MKISFDLASISLLFSLFFSALSGHTFSRGMIYDIAFLNIGGYSLMVRFPYYIHFVGFLFLLLHRFLSLPEPDPYFPEKMLGFLVLFYIFRFATRHFFRE